MFFKIIRYLSSYFILIILTGCELESTLTKIGNWGENAEEQCPSKPQTELRTVKKIKLTNVQMIEESAKVSPEHNIGYIFAGKKGETLNYQTYDSLCIWVFNPKNDILKSNKLNMNGLYILEVSVPKGVKDFNLKLGFNTVTTTQENTTSVGYLSKVGNTSDLNRSKAVEILRNWYAAKPKIFAAPFDKSLVNKYTTDKIRYENLEKCEDSICGGYLGWLKNNKCYYSYDFIKINKIVFFNSSTKSLTVNVTEKLALNGSIPSCDGQYKTSENKFTYLFKKEHNIWKIADKTFESN